MVKLNRRFIVTLALSLLITTVALIVTRSTIVKSQSSAVTLDGRLLYTANYSNDTVSVINNATGQVVTRIAVGVGPTSTTISVDGRRIFVNNSLSKNVSVIDVVSNRVLYTYPSR